MKRSFTVTGVGARTALAFLMALAAATSIHVIVRAQGGPGQNINVVTGTGTFTNDLDLYRKNEPVIGISSVNPAHMLVAYNDARTVDSGDDFGTGSQAAAPGLFAKVLDFFRLPWRLTRERKGGWEADGPAAANLAWIGLSLTNNGGKNWFSGLHPGRYVPIPLDTDPFWADTIQLNLYDAANDPVMATTANQFFLAGIGFNLTAQKTPGQGIGFVSRFTDLNKTEIGQNIHFDGTKVILKPCRTDPTRLCTGWNEQFVTGAATTFLVDKPSVAAGPNGHVYLAFVVFDTTDTLKLSSRVLFFSSQNYGDSWSGPVVVSQPLTRNQSPWIVVDNNDENKVYIGWRVFANPLYPTLTNAVVGRRSFDGGATFSPSVPYPVALLLKAFDQPQGDLRSNTPPVPRSSAYPTATMDVNGALHMMIQEYVYPADYPTISLRGRPLGPGALTTIGVPRITATTSSNQGVTWTLRKAIDLANGAGTQFMPVATAVGEPGTCDGKPGSGPRSRVAVMYYDARPRGIGVTAGTGPGGTGFVAGGDKQFDVRIAQASTPCSANAQAGLSFSPSEQVSQYTRSSRPTTPITNPPSYPIQPIPVQPGFTPPYAAVNRGYTMSCKGNCSFSGDYIHAIPRVPYVKTVDGWKATTAVMAQTDRDKLPAPVVQGVWTDTRDAMLPTVGVLRSVPLGASATIDALPWDDMYYRVNLPDPVTGFANCENLGTRHQSVYTMEYTPGGLFALAPITFRSSTIPRSYPVYVENRTPFKKYYKLTIDSSAIASFDYRTFDTPPAAFARTTSIVIDKISGVTGSVVVGSGVNTPILITIEETDAPPPVGNGNVIAPPAGAKTTVTLNTAGEDTSSTETSVPAIAPTPIVTQPFGPIGSGGVASNTLGGATPFAPNPFAPNPFAPNPFAPNPFAPNPFAPNPFAPNPFAPNNLPDTTPVYAVQDTSYVVKNDGEQTAAFNAVFNEVNTAGTGSHVFEVLINRAVPTSGLVSDINNSGKCKAVDTAQAVPISTITVATPFAPNPFAPNPFAPNPFAPNPFAPNVPPIYSNSTFYVAPKTSTSGAVARVETPGTELARSGPQRLARHEVDGRIRLASMTPATGAYISDPISDVMVVTLRDFVLTPLGVGGGAPVSPNAVKFTVKAELPNVVVCTPGVGTCPGNGRQYDPGGPPSTGTQIPHHLAFTADGQPTNTTAGGTITPAVTVEILDAFGGRLTNCLEGNPNCSLPVTIAIASNPPASGTLSGTKTKNAQNGVATFDNLSIDTAGTGYVLRASSGSLAAALSQPFNITPAKTILIYGPALAALGSGVTTNEQTIAEANGYTVTVKNATDWSAMAKDDFKAFSAIVFPDPNCNPEGVDTPLSTANNTKESWALAVTGPKVVVGTDPVFHAQFNTLGATTLTLNAMNFAASGPGTGMYMSLSCYYFNRTSDTNVPVLSAFGTFTVRGQGAASDTVNVLELNHPVMSNLNDANMSNWGNSMHEWFVVYPQGWKALAQETSLAGTPRTYIIAKP